MVLLPRNRLQKKDDNDSSITFTWYDEKRGRNFTIMKELKSHPGVADGTKSDLDILAAVCEAEAGDQGIAGMKAVALCLLNRTLDKEFPSSVRYVLYQGNYLPPVFSRDKQPAAETSEWSVY